ncbi:MAG TPA: hypothetical protein VJ436_07930 [Anaerolineales bacterium]|nr:hypothetical protein [Anaerolineales bacterium]
MPTLTPTVTATIVWFPPTDTPTAFPTLPVTPTVDYRPGIGEIILRDDFSNGEVWSLGRTASGSAALGKNELTIALSSPGAYQASRRERPALRDYYLEITASPTLCRGQDEYGLLLRATSEQDFLRFSLSCDGQARVDRLAGGAASSPQPWTQNGAIPPGAPSVSRLAVWAAGKEMRFFINDIYLFSVSDPAQANGGLGVFARSGGDLAVTVSFSDLVVREVTE